MKVLVVLGAFVLCTQARVLRTDTNNLDLLKALKHEPFAEYGPPGDDRKKTFEDIPLAPLLPGIVSPDFVIDIEDQHEPAADYGLPAETAHRHIPAPPAPDLPELPAPIRTVVDPIPIYGLPCATTESAPAKAAPAEPAPNEPASVYGPPIPPTLPELPLLSIFEEFAAANGAPVVKEPYVPAPSAPALPEFPEVLAQVFGPPTTEIVPAIILPIVYGPPDADETPSSALPLAPELPVLPELPEPTEAVPAPSNPQPCVCGNGANTTPDTALSTLDSAVIAVAEPVITADLTTPPDESDAPNPSKPRTIDTRALLPEALANADEDAVAHIAAA